MDRAETQAVERTRLRLTCRHLAGNGPTHPAEEFEAVAGWLREQGPQGSGDNFVPGIEPDLYGAGRMVEDFESEVAALFDMPAARFMPSGCMAQPIALRIWSERAHNPNTAFHPTSHLELHEEFGYRELHGLTAHLIGDPKRPTTAADLASMIGAGGAAEDCGLASLLVELPAREIGGQLPSWKELVELSALCRDHDIRLHLDGARVWQAAPAYNRSLAEIAEIFDSIYISFYKDVGALPGAMLLGPTDFIDEAAIWQRRQGGTLFSATANIVSARLHLPRCIERMPRLIQRAREIAPLFDRHERASVTPTPPHTNMFHVTFQGAVDEMLEARDRVARETGIWLFSKLQLNPGHTSTRAEISLGVSSLSLADDEIAEAISLLLR